MVALTLRTCTTCGQEKSLLKFYKDCYGPGGRMMVCKLCHDITVKNAPPKKRKGAASAKTVTCPKCGESKPIEEFSKNKSNKNGLQTYCKLCHRDMVKTSSNNRKARRQSFVSNHKKCCRCGNLFEATKENFYFKKNGKPRSFCKSCYLADEKDKRANKPNCAVVNAHNSETNKTSANDIKQTKKTPRQGAERRYSARLAWASIQSRQDKIEITEDEFSRWWFNEPDNCYYCGISEQEEIERQKFLCGYKGENEQLLAAQSAAERMNYPQRLTTDRKNSFGKYSVGNIVKCCSFCNSAKGNSLTEDEFLVIGPQKRAKIQGAMMQEQNKIIVEQINIEEREILHINLNLLYNLKDKGLDVFDEISQIEMKLAR